jgi:hypothetical protein
MTVARQGGCWLMVFPEGSSWWLKQSSQCIMNKRLNLGDF